MTGHEIGLLKEYMQDLVEQARQESAALHVAGYEPGDYTSEEALMDLLAILDDRLESEGVEVGLSEAFRHRMWEICGKSREFVMESVWLEGNLRPSPATKEDTRQVTYKALMKYIEDEFA